MEEKISVIVPVYNVEPYLERCLDSILQNTYRNLEIICVDDGSTDNCGAILDRYAQRDDRFVVIHKENGGPSAARNRGLDMVTGDFISFVDADDWIHPQYFEILKYYQQQTNSDVSMCKFVRLETVQTSKILEIENLPVKELDLEGIFATHYTRSYVWGRIYRTEILCTYRFEEGITIAEDAALNARAFVERENLKACLLDVPLYFYFSRPSSLTHRPGGYHYFRVARVFEEYAQNAENQVARRLFLIDALKRGLNGRYLMTVWRDEKKKLLECNKLLKRVWKCMWRMNNVARKEKIQYWMLVYFPFTYRLFRLLDDPTLLRMERNLKKRK